MENDRKLLREFNVLKGIAIIFVVLVHICAPFQYLYLKTFIQHFQSFMYLFVFASGFLFNYSGKNISSFCEYRLLVTKKFKHLLIPYISISLIILATKSIASHFYNLKHPITNNMWRDILLNPMGGFASHLWFIYVLFIIFMIFPIIRLVKNYLLMSLIALAVFFINIESNVYFELYFVKFYLVFFCMGYIYSELAVEKINKFAGLFSLVFVALSIVLFINRTYFHTIIEAVAPAVYAKNIYFLLQGIVCIFTYYFLSVVIARRKSIFTDVLDYIGNYSFSIYLLHTIFMGWTCYLLDWYPHHNRNIFIIVLLTFVGLTAPIFSAKYLFVKNRILSMLIFGTYKISFRR